MSDPEPYSVWYMGRASALDEFREALIEAARLLLDVRNGHKDPEDGLNYNHCDTAPCQWCRDADKVISFVTKHVLKAQYTKEAK